MKQKTGKQLWKRSLGIGLSAVLALSMLPAVPVRAGSVDAADAEEDLAQPFAADHEISLRKGQKYFIEGAQEYSSADPAAVKAEAGVESRNALFDCVEYGQYNFAGYSDIPNWEIDMTEAEFVVESAQDTEGAYTIYNPSAGVYLTNFNAGEYFQGEGTAMNLRPAESADGITPFEITRADNNRY